jgi:hypothetical protein
MTQIQTPSVWLYWFHASPNTMDNDMNFVGPFERDIQYTRFINDFDSVKFSPIDRYRGYNFSSKEEVKDDVLPTPFMKKDQSGSVTLDSSWLGSNKFPSY